MEERKAGSAGQRAWLSSKDTTISANSPGVKVEAKAERGGRVLAWVEVSGLPGDVYFTFSVPPEQDSTKTVASPEDLTKVLLSEADDRAAVSEGIGLLAEGWLAEVQAWARDNPDRFPPGWPLQRAAPATLVQP